MNEQRQTDLWLEIEDIVRRDPQTGEQWRDVVDWEGLYQVSNLGQVRSVDRLRPCNGGQRIHKGRILRACLDENGYQHVNLCDGKIRNMISKVHKLVMLAWVGPPPEGLEVCHGIHGKPDNSIGNLSYGTSSKNSLQRRRDGTDNGRPVRRSDGVIFPSISIAAEEMGCSSPNIWAVCNDKHSTAANFGWSYVEPDKLEGKRGGRPVRRSDGKYFESIVAAARATGGVPSNIWRVCQGIRKNHHGYGWEYVKDEETEERNTNAKLSKGNNSNPKVFGTHQESIQ